MDPKGTQMDPKGTQKDPKGTQKDPKGTQKNSELILNTWSKFKSYFKKKRKI